SSLKQAQVARCVAGLQKLHQVMCRKPDEAEVCLGRETENKRGALTADAETERAPLLGQGGAGNSRPLLPGGLVAVCGFRIVAVRNTFNHPRRGHRPRPPLLS